MVYRPNLVLCLLLIKFYWNTATPISLHITHEYFALEQQNSVAVTETVWHKILKYLLSGTSQKKFRGPCFKGLSSTQSY